MKRIPTAVAIDEIIQDRALSGLGALLALTHVFTFFLWFRRLPSLFANNEPALCWPFFESCDRFRPLAVSTTQSILWTYLALSAVTLVLFLSKKVRIACAGLWLLLLIKTVIFAQDYRFMGNYHYMNWIFSLAFLLLPAKRNISILILAAFYISAGFLKFNPEWLSGQAMIAPPILHGKWLEVSCTYVIILEVIFVFGFWSKRAGIFWGTLAQFILFHVFSWHIVGFYYPCIMFCLLSIVPLARLYPNPFPRLKMGKPHLAVIALYAVAQLIPHIHAGDSSITGEGRLFSMNMFDSKSECSSRIMALRDRETIDITPDFDKFGIRIHCDPLLFYSYAKSLCRRRHSSADFIDLDVYLASRKATDPAFRPILEVSNFCSQNLSYSILGFNSWIKK